MPRESTRHKPLLLVLATIAALGSVVLGTEVLHTYSDDGGTRWVAPLPLTARPFNAGWGSVITSPTRSTPPRFAV